MNADHNSSFFSGQASEPQEASKWQCGAIKDAFVELLTCLRLSATPLWQSGTEKEASWPSYLHQMVIGSGQAGKGD